jgi:hypothetical protein
MTTYVTFGQDHVHSINGVTYDKNCVAFFDSDSANEGRRKAFEIFGKKFCFEYWGENFDWNDHSGYYSRGLIEVK